MINVLDLKKSYDGVEAVKGISFSVEKGMLFSFLGTNGAGKSTTINMLTTLLSKTSGQVNIGGFDLDQEEAQIRNLIGVVFQESVLDELLTPKENLMVRGSLYGMNGSKLKKAVNHAIEMTGIQDFANRPYGTLSGGMKRRTDIARALIHTPSLLFLDEPTTGLDPKTRQDIWDLIRNLQITNNMTVFLTTHYMEEAAESDKICVIHQGEIKVQGTPEELKSKYATDVLKLVLIDGTKKEYKLEKTVDALAIIDEKREKIAHLEIISGTLDDVFLNLTRGINHVN